MTKTIARSRDNKNSMNGIVDLHSGWLDQGVLTTSTPTFASCNIDNDLVVNGSLTVAGTTTLINTEILEVKDNIVELNSSEVGLGVTVPLGLAGIQINRGGSTAYQSVFRESDVSFCVGEVGDLQVVATREDNPLNNGVMVYNSSQNRLDSVTSISPVITFSNTTESTTSLTGAVKIAGGLGVIGNIVSDGILYLKGSGYSNFIKSDTSQNLILNSTASINLTATTDIKVPTSIPISFSSSSNFISSSGSNLTAQTSGAFNISGTTVNLLTNSPLTFGNSSQKITYNGTNLVIDASNNLSINPITTFNNNTASSNNNTGSVVYSGGLSISNTTDASSSINGGTITTAGGVAIAKKLYVAGISTFENNTDSTDLSSGSILTNGGISVTKSVNIGYGLTTANTNFSNSPGHGKLIKSNSLSFTDNITSASSSTPVFSSISFGQTTLSSLNSNVTTVDSYTVYIQGPPIQGTNQILPNTYSLYVNTGNTRLGGNLTVTGSFTLDNNLTLQGNLDVNGHTFLDQVSIVTNDGQLSVTGTNPVNINVAAQCTISNTSGNIVVDSQAGILYLDGNTSINLDSTGAINITPGSGSPVNLRTNSALTFGDASHKITYNGTNLVVDATNIFSINPITTFNNSTTSSNSTTASVVYSGGLSISNTTDATSSSNGGTITTAGGVAITKKLYVGGISTFENISETNSLTILGGTTVNKKLIVGSNYSGDPEATNAVFIHTNNSTFTDNITSQDGTVTSVNFNSFAINVLEATNTGISTTNSSTLYIEGCPISGTNQTITNCYSIHVDSGITRLDGDVQIKSTTGSTSLVVDGGVTINKNLIVNSKFDVGANINSSPSSSGVFISLSSRTVTDNVTATSGTATEMLFNVIAQPTLASLNAITTTDTATFVIEGAPIEGVNQTLTNSYSMWIKSGDVRLDSDFISSGLFNILNTTESSSSSSGSFTTLGGVGIAKKLFVAGISTFENTTDTASLSTGSIISLGGVAVSKNINIGNGITSGFSNFSGSAGNGKLLKTNGISFTDNTTLESSTATQFSSVNFGQVTLLAANTGVITTDSYTVYIEGAPLQGTNQTLTNSYSLYVNSGNTRLGGNLTVTGSITTNTNLTVSGTLDVNGPTLLDQVTIVTDDGQFSVTGTNPVNINVAAQCTVSNTSGNIVVDSQAGTLYLDGNNAVHIDSAGAINSTAGASSQIGTTVGTFTISAPTLTTTTTTTNIGATSSVNIGVSNNGIPINIGHSISETIIGDNLTVLGNFTVQGDTTILASTVLTTEDNAIVVNSLPSGISDGGILIRRYQTPNDTSLGQVITDTPYETGTFQDELILGTGASIITDYYKGWWIKITSGDASGFVRRIKSSNSSRVITVYVTADNVGTFVDGLDLTQTIATGDTYELYPGTHSGMFFNEGLSEFSIGNVPFDSGAGVFPLVGYKNLHLNRLTVEDGIVFTGDALFDSKFIVDITDSEALLVRKNSDSGDVFYINTSSPSLNISNPINTINSSVYSNFLGYDSVGTQVSYSRIESKIKDNTTTSVNGELILGVAVNSVIENYLIIDGNTGLTTINNLVSLTDTTASTSSVASLKLAGGITTTNTTDSTSSTSGGSLTTVGGLAVGKKLYVGSDPFFNSAGTGSGIITIGPSSTNGESSLSFYGDTSYSGQLWKLGHGLSGSSTNSFTLYNSFTTSNIITVDKTGFTTFPISTVSSSTSTGAVVISGGVGIGLDLNVGGNITGTWNGSVISVAKGGTGASTFTSNAVLLGNGTSAIQAGSNITYSTDTLSLPKLTSTDTTDSSSSITGAVTLSGGLGVAKKIYVGTDINIGGNILLTSTDSNIGKTTVDGSDSGSISIFSGGAIVDSRGSSLILKGNEHVTNPGSVVLTCGNVNSTGFLSIVTSSTERVNVSYDGVVTFPNTDNATSSTVAPVVISGGLAIDKDLYIGGDLYLTGSLPGQTSVTNPSVTTSSLVNITSSTAVNVVVKKVYNEVTFSCAFTVVPSAVNSSCTFEFTLPQVVTNIANVYDVILSVNGHLTDFTPIENKTAHGVVGATRAKAYFTSGPTVATHYIHIIANYTIV